MTAQCRCACSQFAGGFQKPSPTLTTPPDVQVAQKPVQSLLEGVLTEVAGEVANQDEKWGEQNHPMHGGPSLDRGTTVKFAQSEADFWKRINDSRVRKRVLGWDTILYEEAFEAFAETDPALIREELVQVAAVAVNAILSFDRKVK